MKVYSGPTYTFSDRLSQSCRNRAVPVSKKKRTIGNVVMLF